MVDPPWEASEVVSHVASPTNQRWTIATVGHRLVCLFVSFDGPFSASAFYGLAGRLVRHYQIIEQARRALTPAAPKPNWTTTTREREKERDRTNVPHHYSFIQMWTAIIVEPPMGNCMHILGLLRSPVWDSGLGTCERLALQAQTANLTRRQTRVINAG